MGSVTLQQAIDHLRLEDNPEDMAYVESLIDAATQHVARYLNRPFPWVDDDGEPVETPDPVRHAILMLMADLYEHRTTTVEGVRVRENPVAQRLLDLYREGIGV